MARMKIVKWDVENEMNVTDQVKTALTRWIKKSLITKTGSCISKWAIIGCWYGTRSRHGDNGWGV